VLDITRGRINLKKGTYQSRARGVVILARLDFSGRNPDNQEIGSPHLHLYREGYGDRLAFPVPPAAFPNLADSWATLQDFMRFINLTLTPDIRPSLFL
jgi:hypothetical protein